MRDLTLAGVERLPTAEADDTFHMDEDTFRTFYDRTARPVWAYLSRMTGDKQVADDLLQETYYRFLRTNRSYASEAHRRNYLFRIATNLVRDARRRRPPTLVAVPEETDPDALRSHDDIAGRTALRADLSRAMANLSSREQAMLWLAYAQGSSHDEIAQSLGLKTSSIKLLLFRARRRLAQLLRGSQVAPARERIRR